MRLNLIARAALAAGALLALGAGARLWPTPEFSPPARLVRPLPEDLCMAGREGQCLAPGYAAQELVSLYRLPPESADRISVDKSGAISFDADRAGTEN